MDSFVRNTLDLLYAPLRGGVWSVKNTDGVSKDVRVWGSEVMADEGQDTYGILVGSSNQAFSVDDYNLISKIPHGTGAGQLNYGDIPSVDVYTDYLEFARVFDNYSGGDVTVYEIGVAVRTTQLYDGTNETNYVLLARDVISATTVPNNGRLSVTYTFKINP